MSYIYSLMMFVAVLFINPFVCSTSVSTDTNSLMTIDQLIQKIQEIGKFKNREWNEKTLQELELIFGQIKLKGLSRNDLNTLMKELNSQRNEPLLSAPIVRRLKGIVDLLNFLEEDDRGWFYHANNITLHSKEDGTYFYLNNKRKVYFESLSSRSDLESIGACSSGIYFLDTKTYEYDGKLLPSYRLQIYVNDKNPKPDPRGDYWLSRDYIHDYENSGSFGTTLNTRSVDDEKNVEFELRQKDIDSRPLDVIHSNQMIIAPTCKTYTVKISYADYMKIKEHLYGWDNKVLYLDNLISCKQNNVELKDKVKLRSEFYPERRGKIESFISLITK